MEPSQTAEAFPAVGAWLGASAHCLTARIGPSIAADRSSEVGQPVIANAPGRWYG